MVDLATVGVAVVLIGFGVILVALLQSWSGDAKVRGGGVLLIGPIPVIFGSDTRWVIVAVVLAIVLIVLSLTAYGV